MGIEAALQGPHGVHLPAVAAERNRLEVAPVGALAYLADQLVAVHIGHAQVRDQQVVASCLQHFQRLLAAGGHVNSRALQAQQRRKRLQQVDHVIDRQNPQPLEVSARQVGFFVLHLGLRQRQPDGQARALADALRIGQHLAALCHR